MRVMAIRYVRDVEGARRFYEALGLTLDFVSRRPRKGRSAGLDRAGWVRFPGKPRPASVGRGTGQPD
jgi:hypothetical protein